MKVFEIIQAGIHSSIQDVGRFGSRNYAIPQSGCLDIRSQYLANYLVGNSPNAVVIEIIGGRFECKTLADTSVGIIGAGSTVRVNGKMQQYHKTIHLKQNDVLKIEGSGLAYLAVAGSIQARLHFESVSTYSLAKLGGLNGDVLKKGDCISTKLNQSRNTRSLPEQVIPKHSKHQVIRILRAPELEERKIKEIDFEKMKWQISSQSNRMGIRLEGNPLDQSKIEMNPVPTFPGTIQLTHQGLPIILMNDGQTTGGYPRIGQIIKADLPRLGRMILGGSLKFKFVDISEARYILNQKETFLKHALN